MSTVVNPLGTVLGGVRDHFCEQFSYTGMLYVLIKIVIVDVN